MLLTVFLAIVFCAAMALMLISAVAFIQDNKFFSSAPKEAREVLVQRDHELFYGARAIGWTLFIISILMILGVGVIAVWDGFRSGFTFRQFFLRFVLIPEIPFLSVLLPRGGTCDGGKKIRLQHQKPAAEAAGYFPGGVCACGLDLHPVLTRNRNGSALRLS